MDKDLFKDYLKEGEPDKVSRGGCMEYCNQMTGNRLLLVFMGKEQE